MIKPREPFSTKTESAATAREMAAGSSSNRVPTEEKKRATKGAGRLPRECAATSPANNSRVNGMSQVSSPRKRQFRGTSIISATESPSRVRRNRAQASTSPAGADSNRRSEGRKSAGERDDSPREISVANETASSSPSTSMAGRIARNSRGWRWLRSEGRQRAENEGSPTPTVTCAAAEPLEDGGVGQSREQAEKQDPQGLAEGGEETQGERGEVAEERGEGHPEGVTQGVGEEVTQGVGWREGEEDGAGLVLERRRNGLAMAGICVGETAGRYSGGGVCGGGGGARRRERGERAGDGGGGGSP